MTMTKEKVFDSDKETLYTGEYTSPLFVCTWNGNYIQLHTEHSLYSLRMMINALAGLLQNCTNIFIREQAYHLGLTIIILHLVARI